ncbi:MAG: type IX secretion system membrane protein PorP/SprF [Taibaiella sp.]|nr:type IX secretion system membrane protein PorP/SprF [Taibaiella sp.]
MVYLKKIFLAVVIVLVSIGAFAQQDAGFSMYFFNPLYFNPGYAGSREVFSGTVVDRNQWIGVSGAPTTQSLTLHSALPGMRVGLGLQIYNDQAGPMRNTGINLTYAYHLPINEKTKISFGLTGMLNNISIGWSSINIDNRSDPAFMGNASTSWVGDASAGVYLYQPRFYIGFSVNHLLQSRFGTTHAAGADLAKFYRQYYLTSGIVLPINKKIDFRPSILAKYVNAAPAVGEIDGTFIFLQRLFVGVGYRIDKRVNMHGIDNMLIGIMEFEITNYLRIGYSYDYYLSQTGSYNSGTHEFMLGWDISGTKTKLSSPRFF